MGLYDSTFGGHSILVYRLRANWEIFDSNLGEKVTAANPQEAARAVIYCLNKSITQGTDKYTLFDKLWHKSVLFKVGASIFFPVSVPWLAHDVFIAKRKPEEILKKSPLTKTAWLSWGKVSARPIASSTLDTLNQSAQKSKETASLKEEALKPHPHAFFNRIAKENVPILEPASVNRNTSLIPR